MTNSRDLSPNKIDRQRQAEKQEKPQGTSDISLTRGRSSNKGKIADFNILQYELHEKGESEQQKIEYKLDQKNDINTNKPIKEAEEKNAYTSENDVVDSIPYVLGKIQDEKQKLVDECKDYARLKTDKEKDPYACLNKLIAMSDRNQTYIERATKSLAAISMGQIDVPNNFSTQSIEQEIEQEITEAKDFYKFIKSEAKVIFNERQGTLPDYYGGSSIISEVAREIQKTDPYAPLPLSKNRTEVVGDTSSDTSLMNIEEMDIKKGDIGRVKRLMDDENYLENRAKSRRNSEDASIRKFESKSAESAYNNFLSKNIQEIDIPRDGVVEVYHSPEAMQDIEYTSDQSSTIFKLQADLASKTFDFESRLGEIKQKFEVLKGSQEIDTQFVKNYQKLEDLESKSSDQKKRYMKEMRRIKQQNQSDVGITEEKRAVETQDSWVTSFDKTLREIQVILPFYENELHKYPDIQEKYNNLMNDNTKSRSNTEDKLVKEFESIDVNERKNEISEVSHEKEAKIEDFPINLLDYVKVSPESPILKLNVGRDQHSKNDTDILEVTQKVGNMTRELRPLFSDDSPLNMALQYNTSLSSFNSSMNAAVSYSLIVGEALKRRGGSLEVKQSWKEINEEIIKAGKFLISKFSDKSPVKNPNPDSWPTSEREMVTSIEKNLSKALQTLAKAALSEALGGTDFLPTKPTNQDQRSRNQEKMNEKELTQLFFTGNETQKDFAVQTKLTLGYLEYYNELAHTEQLPSTQTFKNAYEAAQKIVQIKDSRGITSEKLSQLQDICETFKETAEKNPEQFLPYLKQALAKARILHNWAVDFQTRFDLNEDWVQDGIEKLGISADNFHESHVDLLANGSEKSEIILNISDDQRPRPIDEIIEDYQANPHEIVSTYRDFMRSKAPLEHIHSLLKEGIPVLGIPKTIHGRKIVDVSGTDFSCLPRAILLTAHPEWPDDFREKEAVEAKKHVVTELEKRVNEYKEKVVQVEHNIVNRLIEPDKNFKAEFEKRVQSEIKKDQSGSSLKSDYIKKVVYSTITKIAQEEASEELEMHDIEDIHVKVNDMLNAGGNSGKILLEYMRDRIVTDPETGNEGYLLDPDRTLLTYQYLSNERKIQCFETFPGTSKKPSYAIFREDTSIEHFRAVLPPEEVESEKKRMNGMTMT